MYVSCGAVIEYSISSTATNQLFAPQVRRQKPSPCVMAACFGRMVEYGRYSNYASHQSLCSMLSLMCKLPTHSTFTICCKGSNWAFTSYAVARVPVLKRVYAKVWVWFRGEFRGFESCYFLTVGSETCLQHCSQDKPTWATAHASMYNVWCQLGTSTSTVATAF